METKARRLKYLWGLWGSRLIDWPLVKPRSVTVTLTSRCNLRCVMCNHWKHPTRPEEEIPYDQAARVISEAADWGVPEIELSGGEPMLRSDFLDLLRHARRCGIGVNVTTNGTLIDEEAAGEFARTDGLRLQISLDGASADTHDWVRGVPGGFERIMAGVERMRRAGCGGDGTPYNATTVIVDRNLDELEQIIGLARELGFASITFQPAVDDNLDIMARNPDNPLRPRGERLADLDRAIDRIVRIGETDGFIGNGRGNLESIKDFFRDRLDPGEIRCYAGYIACIVSPDGQLWSCMGNVGPVAGPGLRNQWTATQARLRRRQIRACRKPCLYPCYLDGDADSIVEATARILKE